MERIVEKLRKFGYVDGEEREDRQTTGSVRKPEEEGSVEEIFREEEGVLPNTRGGFSRESPLGLGSGGELRFPWEKKSLEGTEKGIWNATKSKSRTSLAELTLPESELRRLRSLMFKIKNRTRVKNGGVTEAVVDAIHEKWKTSEVVRLKIEGTPALNMKRLHEILEVSFSVHHGLSYCLSSIYMFIKLYACLSEFGCG